MQDERETYASIPEAYRPLSTWGFFGYFVLFSIPIIGFIMLIVFALNNTNICRRNYARSFFCIYIILFIVAAVLVATGGFAILTQSVQ